MTSSRHAPAPAAPPADAVPAAGPGWVVDSPAVGTGLTARPCGDTLRPAEPPATAHPVALALSGGGFRATLAGLGFVRLLADTGLLPRLRYSSSVSGGSIANGCLAAAWPELRQEGFTAQAVDAIAIAPLVDRLASHSLKRPSSAACGAPSAPPPARTCWPGAWTSGSSRRPNWSGWTRRCAGSSTRPT